MQLLLCAGQMPSAPGTAPNSAGLLAPCQAVTCCSMQSWPCLALGAQSGHPAFSRRALVPCSRFETLWLPCAGPDSAVLPLRAPASDASALTPHLRHAGAALPGPGPAASRAPRHRGEQALPLCAVPGPQEGSLQARRLLQGGHGSIHLPAWARCASMTSAGWPCHKQPPRAPWCLLPAQPLTRQPTVQTCSARWALQGTFLLTFDLQA